MSYDINKLTIDIGDMSTVTLTDDFSNWITSTPEKLSFSDQLEACVLRKYVGEFFEVIKTSSVYNMAPPDQYLLVKISDDLQTCEVMKKGEEALVEVPTNVVMYSMAALEVK